VGTGIIQREMTDDKGGEELQDGDRINETESVEVTQTLYIG
jgi:hypothetical protein